MLSMITNSMRRVASSKSELVMLPEWFATGWISSIMRVGHWKWKIVGGMESHSPMTMPPTPCFDTLVMPMAWGHPTTRLLHFVEDDMDSQRKIMHSQMAFVMRGFLQR
jgi:hypothetical protein